jgi:hypothetical protein
VCDWTEVRSQKKNKGELLLREQNIGPIRYNKLPLKVILFLKVGNKNMLSVIAFWIKTRLETECIILWYTSMCEIMQIAEI